MWSSVVEPPQLFPGSSDCLKYRLRAGLITLRSLIQIQPPQPNFRKLAHKPDHAAAPSMGLFWFGPYPDHNRTATRFRSKPKFLPLEITGDFPHSGGMALLPPLEPLLDAKAVAETLGLHPQTILRLARRGLLPGIYCARRWRFRRTDLVQWIERQIPPLPSAPEAPYTSSTTPSESALTG